MNKKIAWMLVVGLFASRVVFGAPPTVVNTSQAPVESEAFKLMLSPKTDAHSTVYTVMKGDSLALISKKFQATVDLLKKINELKSDQLNVGMKIKVPSYKWSLVVDKSQNTLVLKGNEDVLKTYTVATGRNNSTPVGVFKITDKLVHPTWYHAGKVIPYGNPDNVLGTRWMGLTKKGYGIHGTVEPDKLGQQVTDGCVRMRNEEVEELFSMIPKDTEVTILD